VLRDEASFVASLLTPGFGAGSPHQLRHAHAVELAREGVPLNIIQRQLGHVNLGTTSIYLRGIDTEEIIWAVNSRRAPMMPPAPVSSSETSISESGSRRRVLPLRPAETNKRAACRKATAVRPLCSSAGRLC
jgi:hypothetical protein